MIVSYTEINHNKVLSHSIMSLYYTCGKYNKQKKETTIYPNKHYFLSM